MRMKRVEVYLGKRLRDSPSISKVTTALHGALGSSGLDGKYKFELSYDYPPDYISNPIEADKAHRLANEINSMPGYCAKVINADMYSRKFGRSSGRIPRESENIF